MWVCIVLKFMFFIRYTTIIYKYWLISSQNTIIKQIFDLKLNIEVCQKLLSTFIVYNSWMLYQINLMQMIYFLFFQNKLYLLHQLIHHFVHIHVLLINVGMHVWKLVYLQFIVFIKVIESRLPLLILISRYLNVLI